MNNGNEITVSKQAKEKQIQSSRRVFSKISRIIQIFYRYMELNKT
jgi:hypothetical protein